MSRQRDADETRRDQQNDCLHDFPPLRLRVEKRTVPGNAHNGCETRPPSDRKSDPRMPEYRTGWSGRFDVFLWTHTLHRQRARVTLAWRYFAQSFWVCTISSSSASAFSVAVQITSMACMAKSSAPAALRSRT